MDKVEITAKELDAYTYTVTKTAGENGTITGPDTVTETEDAVFTITPNKGYLVEDGKVKIEGLKSDVQYDFFVYGKKDGKYYDLGVRKLVKAALKKPTELEVKFTIIEKNDEKFIQIYYKVDTFLFIYYKLLFLYLLLKYYILQ